jgi:hypothetical protein
LHSKLGANETLVAGIALLFAVFLAALFGLAGLRVGLGLAFLYFLPLYLILSRFELTAGEKAIFSIFLSLGAYPTLAYWIGFLVPFRAALLLSFALLIGGWFLVGKVKKLKEEKSHN